MGFAQGKPVFVNPCRIDSIKEASVIPEHYQMDLDFPGRLYICPKPRGHDWIEDEIRGFSDLGVQALVSLLTLDEALDFGLCEEKWFCEQFGIQFTQFPVDHQGLPDRFKSFFELSLSCLQLLHQGKKIAVHSRAGIGRTSLFSASVLYFHGIWPEQALEKIEEARGYAIPDTEEQKDWILGLERFTENISDLVMDRSSRNLGE
jgi:protein-tyrosine phosphatase